MAKASDDSNQNQPGVRGPYFCEECKRNHTKGKIYKEHLSFAKFESVDDDVEDNKEISNPVSEDDDPSKEDVISSELNEVEEIYEEIG